MGAFSQVTAFDFNRHCQVVVPALREFMASGTLPEELQPVFDPLYHQALAAKAKYPQTRQMEQVQRVKAGLGLDLRRDCPCLDEILGVKHESIADLTVIRPSIRGGCVSEICGARRICPFNPLSRNEAAEWEMGLFQQMVKTSCLDAPPLVLGRSFQFYDVAWWYGNEVGLEYDEAKRFFLAARDDLALLLARLCKRGGVWGWRDGGYGEGLLGWLSGEECLRLAEGLDAYDLDEASPPPELSDAYLREQILPEMRATMAQLRDFARVCGRQQMGILLERL